MGISPVFAVPKMLDAVGLKKEDVDTYEVCAYLLDERSLTSIFTDQRSLCISIRVLRRPAGHFYRED